MEQAQGPPDALRRGQCRVSGAYLWQTPEQAAVEQAQGPPDALMSFQRWLAVAPRAHVPRAACRVPRAHVAPRAHVDRQLPAGVGCRAPAVLRQQPSVDVSTTTYE